MYGEYHFGGFWRIIERFGFISEPQQFFLSISLANIYTEVNERSVDFVVHCVWSGQIRSALDCDRALVVFFTGTAPRTIPLVHNEDNFAVHTNAVVTACASVVRKAIPNTLCGKLPDNTMGCNAVDTMRSFSRVIVREIFVRNQ